jgi:copper chaperone CopZ
MMKKFVVALSALTLSLSAGAALACGDGACDGESCALEAKDKAHGEHVAPAKAVTVKPGYTLATFAVDGMVCINCANKVTATLKGIKGVDAVSVDLNAGKASVSYDKKAVEPAKVVEIVSKLGYKVKQI